MTEQSESAPGLAWEPGGGTGTEMKDVLVEPVEKHAAHMREGTSYEVLKARVDRAKEQFPKLVDYAGNVMAAVALADPLLRCLPREVQTHIIMHCTTIVADTLALLDEANEPGPLGL